MRDEDETDSAYIRRKFDEAADLEALDEVDELLRAEGLNPDNIRPYKSKRRKELVKQQKTSTAVTRTGGQLSAEAIVDNLAWPTSVNGEVDPAFVAGMRYEAMNVIRGIRMAQELNKMGLEQAKPVIEMAKEMRAAEGPAAQIIAAQLGQVTMQSNQQIISAIQGLAAAQGQSQPAEVNPMMKTMADAMQPFLAQTMQQLFSGIFKAGPQPGAAGQQPAIQQSAEQQPGQQPQQEWTPPNITDRSIGEYEEGQDV